MRVPRLKGLQAAVRRAVCAHASLERIGAHYAGKFGNGISRKHVVHHVDARLVRANRASVNGELEAVFAHAHIACCKAQVGALPSAMRAVIGAKLAVVHVIVFQRFAALLAKTAVGDAIGGKPQAAFDAKRHRFIRNARGNSGAQRVVAIVDKGGFGRLRKRRGNSVLHTVHFAEAVKLVAEQVQQHEITRAHARQHILGVHFVAFEARKRAA